MINIKEILNDIVKYTYGADCNPRYHKFYVEISDKNYKSKIGHYRYDNHNIVIFNTYRDDESIVKTTIHELAHHIDYCNRGESDHSPTFYAEYAKLLYTAMNMRLFNRDEFLECERDSTDYNKVCRILDKYEPNYINYKTDKWRVSVYNSYNYREYLKSQGYTYNGNMKCWEKEVDDGEAEYEKLKDLDGVEIKHNSATELHFKGKIKVIAEGNTYTHKEELKKAGFRFKDKRWYTKLRTRMMLAG